MNDIDFYRQQLSEYSHRAFRRHLVGGTGGNLSIRIPGTDTVLVTPTGISLEEVAPAQNILVNLEGEILESPQDLNGSKETGFHLAAYKLKPGVGGIAHVHPPYATAYSNKVRPLPLATISARVVLKHVPCIECFAPGSAELRKAVMGGIQENPEADCILMKEHGILAMGRDLRHAYYISDLTEDTAKIAYVAATIPD
jgi:L-ribulose-5-phosphate 4-epimerase